MHVITQVGMIERVGIGRIIEGRNVLRGEPSDVTYRVSKERGL